MQGWCHVRLCLSFLLEELLVDIFDWSALDVVLNIWLMPVLMAATLFSMVSEIFGAIFLVRDHARKVSNRRVGFVECFVWTSFVVNDGS